MSNNFRTIFFDFDGTLSNDRFYKPIVSEDLLDEITQVLFDEKLKELVFPWMRGEMNYKEVHREISDKMNSNPEHLDESLIESLKDWEMNKKLLDFAKEMRGEGVQTVIFSDNMDVFTEYLIPFNDLDQYFDYIFCSYDFDAMKLDNEGEFIDYALEETDTAPKEALFIDDFEELGSEVEKKGAEFYYYEDYGEEFGGFKNWFHQNL